MEEGNLQIPISLPSWIRRMIHFAIHLDGNIIWKFAYHAYTFLPFFCVWVAKRFLKQAKLKRERYILYFAKQMRAERSLMHNKMHRLLLDWENAKCLSLHVSMSDSSYLKYLLESTSSMPITKSFGYKFWHSHILLPVRKKRCILKSKLLKDGQGFVSAR